MQAKPIPHPVVCGFAWSGLMFVVAIAFFGLKYIWMLLANAQSVAIIRDDQWLSMGILLAISFVAGFATAWVRRHRTPIRPTADCASI
jgi:hypothetical protein